MPRRSLPFLMGILVLAFLVGANCLVLASDKRDCYRGRLDADGDGYARNGSTTEKVSVKHSEKLNCPSGWVRKAGDLQDNNKDIHPRRPEVANNGVDDNCNSKTDEPEFIYPHEIRDNWVATDSFRIKLKLNDQRLYSAGRRLNAVVRVQPLHDTASRTDVTINNVHVGREGRDRVASIRVRNLQPGTVYRAWVQFKDAATGSDLGARTEWYYSATDHSEPHMNRRTAILLRGFKEYNESQMGKVGYRGSEYKDGTKYGASKKELWCSEFYAWVTKPYLEGIAKRSSVSSLRRFFRQRNQYDRINTDVLTRARAGDYISMDTDDNKKKDHSGMFLAWEPARNTVWLLEGNTSGNEVDIRERPPSDVDGLGHITSAMPLSNHQACKRYCDSTPKCVKCSTKIGCGPGYKRLRSYTGPGTNYHACAEYKRSKGNREKCEKWCREHSNCAKCDTNIGCGVGYKKIKSFTKGGTNWYACRERGGGGRSHREACEEWCRARSECAKCSTKRGCGIGYKRLKSWTGKGTNWHACERR